MRASSRRGLQATLALALLVSCLFTAEAYASSRAGVSNEFVWGALLTVGLALVTGYARGVNEHIIKVERRAEKRLDAVDTELAQQQTQINMMRESFQDKLDAVHDTHPRSEEFNRVVKAIDRLHQRLDQLLPVAHRGPPS